MNDCSFTNIPQLKSLIHPPTPIDSIEECANCKRRNYIKLIFGVDKEGKVTNWNKNAHKLVGYSSEEVMGQHLVEQFVTPEHRKRVQCVIDQALACVETANFSE